MSYYRQAKSRLARRRVAMVDRSATTLTSPDANREAVALRTSNLTIRRISTGWRLAGSDSARVCGAG
jgi:hypothetical protein